MKTVNLIKLSLLTIWVVFTLSLLSRIVIANMLSGEGATLQKLSITADELKLQNQVLENQIASKSSLLYIEKRATELGFQPIKKVEYLK